MDSRKFGRYLRSLRKAAGLNLTELAKRSGVSQPYLSQVEGGKRGIPTPDMLKKLAGPLGVEHQELMVEAAHVKYEDLMGTLKDDEVYGRILFEKWDASLQNNLTDILESDEPISYNKRMLTKEDRQRVLDMLKVLFPE
jgi:transcriptional regulator with XRE-family HTH domain